MAIKLWNGLGEIDHPFAVAGKTSTTTMPRVIDGDPQTDMVVDHTVTPVQGNLGIPSTLPSILDDEQHADSTAVFDGGGMIGPSPVPASLTTIGNSSRPVPAGTATTIVRITPQTFSKESGLAPFDLIFHDFDVQALPVYNFWTIDELTDDKTERGERKLEDVPRYVRVSWERAPDIQNVRALIPSSKLHRHIDPVMFGSELERPVPVSVKGVTFLPDHLQPMKFSLVKNSIANGYIAPGILMTNVEMSVRDSGIDQASQVPNKGPASFVDEDAFLTNPETTGLSIHELRANVHQITNAVLGSARILESPLSPQAANDADEHFIGKFSVDRSSHVDGTMRIEKLDATSPVVSIDSLSSVPTEKGPGDPVIGLATRISESPIARAGRKTITARAAFVNTSLGGAVSQEKVALLSEPHHIESMVAVATSLPNLEILAQTGFQDQPRQARIPSYPSPPSVPQLEYAGYILQKFKRGSNGVFQLVEEIDLPNIDYTVYYDTKVVYGETYRYRVRSVIRWTRPATVGPFGNEKLTTAQFGSQTRSLAFHRSSYFAGEWSGRWGYTTVMDSIPPAPPDELNVRAESARKRIVVTMKLPYNPQRDIYMIRLFRKLQDSRGKDLTGWKQAVEYGSVDRKVDFGPQNVLYYDTDVDFFQTNGIRYVYTAQCVSRHHELSALSEQIGVRLNQQFAVAGEYPADFVSCAGVRMEHFGSFSSYPPRRTKSEIVGQSPEDAAPHDRQSVSMIFSGRNGLSNGSRDTGKYVGRIMSLDTGEERDFPISVTYSPQKQQVRTIPIGSYVPQSSPLKTAGVTGTSTVRDHRKIGQLGQAGPVSLPTMKSKPQERR